MPTQSLPRAKAGSFPAVISTDVDGGPPAFRLWALARHSPIRPGTQREVEDPASKEFQPQMNADERR